MLLLQCRIAYRRTAYKRSCKCVTDVLLETSLFVSIFHGEMHSCRSFCGAFARQACGTGFWAFRPFSALKGAGGAPRALRVAARRVWDERKFRFFIEACELPNRRAVDAARHRVQGEQSTEHCRAHGPFSHHI